MVVSKGKEDYLSRTEVKEYLGVGDRVVKNLFLRPDFPSTEIGKGRKVIKMKDLIESLDRNGRRRYRI